MLVSEVAWLYYESRSCKNTGTVLELSTELSTER